MLAKIFGLVLGVLGVTTVIVDAPARPTTAVLKAEPSVIKMIEKTATSTNGELAQKTKAAITSTTKVHTQKIPKKPEVKPPPKVTPPAAEAPRLATTSALSASSSPLSTFNLKLETNLPPSDFNLINQKTRKALVNIICTSQTAGSFEPLSGSGVIINPRGIILTNAHVAQYFLLEDYRTKNFLTCIARTGSPATPKYTLKLLYISKQWVQENYKNITSQKPVGTGENDYALLQITGSTNPDIKLPAAFPAITFESNEDKIKTNDQILLASYPAGFLGGIAIQRDLYIVSTIVNIGKRYTFKDGTLDAFSLGGSPVAQHGSSGSGAISGSGKLLGIIVTSTDATDTSSRDLDAISIAHINRSLSTETHLTLDSLFASDIAAFGKTFDEETLPNLKKLFIDELDSKNR